MEKIEVFDFETIKVNEKIVPYAISYSDTNNFHFVKIYENTYTNAALFILENFKDGHHYYAHNLLFDFLQILSGLIKLKIKFEWTFVDYELYGVKIKYNNKVINLKCSYKIIPRSLENFYPILAKFRKLYFPYDQFNLNTLNWKCSKFENIEKNYHDLTLENYIQIYAIRDVEILKEGIINFWLTLKNIGISFDGNIFTSGAIALKYYIKNWNKINLNLSSINKNIIRKAYYGGRCEVFGNVLDNEKILHFDFVGMYQQCMLENIPYGEFTLKNASSNNIEEPGFYYIEIEYYNNIPILPTKDDKLYFTSGKIRGWYWFEEILFLLQTVKPIYFRILFKLITNEYEKVLVDFVSNLNKIREEGGIKKDVGKLLINAFYGRMAMNEEMNLIKLKETITHEKIYGKIDDFFIIKQKIKKKKIKANIAVAASITAKARIKLYKAMLEIEKNKGRVLYCDTDSIVAAFNKEEKVENMRMGDVYFDTTKNDTVLNDAVFICPKTYGMVLADGKEIIKIKGINSKILSFNEIKEKFYKGVEKINLFSTEFNKTNLNISIDVQNKQIELQSYNKRLWDSTKKFTSPRIAV